MEPAAIVRTSLMKINACQCFVTSEEAEDGDSGRGRAGAWQNEHIKALGQPFTQTLLATLVAKGKSTSSSLANKGRAEHTQLMKEHSGPRLTAGIGHRMK